MKKKLIVIEGSDGSGKSTQQALLLDALKSAGVPHRMVAFPRYESESSALIRMYLGGQFGKDPDLVNPYAASTFFAVDRYASFVTEWGEDYERGVPIICDRYTTANAIHQASKLEDEALEGYLSWLFDFEYRLLGLPEPDLVIYLDLPTELSLKLLCSRVEGERDIHELDEGYLARCRKMALSICHRYGWHKIDCAEDGRMRDRESVAEEIRTLVFERFGLNE